MGERRDEPARDTQWTLIETLWIDCLQFGEVRRRISPYFRSPWKKSSKAKQSHFQCCGQQCVVDFVVLQLSVSREGNDRKLATIIYVRFTYESKRYPPRYVLFYRSDFHLFRHVLPRQPFDSHYRLQTMTT